MTSERIEEALSAPVTAWCTRYLSAGHGLRLRADRRLSTDGEALSVAKASVRLSVTTAGRDGLVSAVLGEKILGQDANAADAKLLADFAARLLEDLVQGIAAALPAVDVSQALHLDVMIGGMAIGTLSVPADAITMLVRKAISVPRSSSSPALVPRRRALGPTKVGVEASIGAATLLVGELRGLATGDVIILDRLVASGADLRIEATDRSLARGEISTSEGANRLTILSTAA